MAEYNAVYIPAASTSTAAPKLPESTPVTKKKSERAPQQKSQLKPWVLNSLKVAAIITIAAVVFGMLASVISINKKIVANNKEISKLSDQLSASNAENVRLRASLGSIISADKIQNYAEDVLGMQKAERYQIHYFENRDGDKVVISDGKALNADKAGN